MGRTYVRDGFKMVQIGHPDSWMKGGRCYQVIADGVGFVGTVGTYMETFEDRSPGKRYVNRRWRSERWWSERWWSELPGEVRHRRGRFFEGPGEAAKSLIWRAGRARADKQRAAEEATETKLAEARGKG